MNNGSSDAQRAHSANRKDEGSSGDSRGDEEDLQDTQQNEEDIESGQGASEQVRIRRSTKKHLLTTHSRPQNEESRDNGQGGTCKRV